MPGGAWSAAGAATCAGLPSRAAVDDRVQPPDVAAQHVRERRRHLRDVAPAARCADKAFQTRGRGAPGFFGNAVEEAADTRLRVPVGGQQKLAIGSAALPDELGRASCREGVSQYV